MCPMRKSRSKIVCECFKLTRADVVLAIRKGGARTLSDLKDQNGAGSACMVCHPALCALLARVPKT